mmetsp:Transcript_13013/g.28085  ORF Transcript_13013/g.28085 Transcript_13013/m.28085 type:complete len:286 (+) Transcript_13013:145-1002(+)
MLSDILATPTDVVQNFEKRIGDRLRAFRDRLDAGTALHVPRDHRRGLFVVLRNDGQHGVGQRLADRQALRRGVSPELGVDDRVVNRALYQRHEHQVQNAAGRLLKVDTVLPLQLALTREQEVRHLVVDPGGEFVVLGVEQPGAVVCDAPQHHAVLVRVARFHALHRANVKRSERVPVLDWRDLIICLRAQLQGVAYQAHHVLRNDVISHECWDEGPSLCSVAISVIERHHDGRVAILFSAKVFYVIRIIWGPLSLVRWLSHIVQRHQSKSKVIVVNFSSFAIFEV